jgi:RNA polymerase sigma factor (TIGR02999 family)
MAELATSGDGSKHVSSEEIVAELYAELRQLAAAKMARVAEGQTFQATALVHEAYLRLVKDPSQRWANRSHFFAAAAEAMRRILVEQARRKAAIRHGGGVVREPLDGIEISVPEPEERLIQVSEVLDELEAIQPVQAQVVRLRFFAGLDHAEVAALLGVSEKTARRVWNSAKLWLYERIAKDG